MGQEILQLPIKPFGAQLRGLTCPDRFVFVGGGWGSGKTDWLAIFEHLRCVASNPNLGGMLISPTYRTQRRTIYATLVKNLPGAKRWPTRSDRARAALGPMVKDWSSQDLVLTWWNDARTYFASADVPGSLEGVNLAWVLLDEGRLISREAWEIASARVRDPASRCRRRCVASVPQIGWLWEEFNSGIPGRTYIKARTADNPFLPKDYASDLAASLSPQMAKAYLGGEFVVLAGLVFHTYNPTPAKEGGSLLPVLPKAGRRTFGTIDPGYRRPAFLLIQDVPVAGGRTVEVVVDEVVLANSLEKRHAHAIADACQRWGVQMEECYIDPAGDHSNAAVGRSAIDAYEAVFAERSVLLAKGLQWTLSPIERYIPNGVEAVRARFTDHQDQRRLFIASRLADPKVTSKYPPAPVGIHRSLLGYQYPEGKTGKSDHPVKDKVNEDFADALRYYVINRWGVLDLDEDGAGRSPPGARTEASGEGGMFADPEVYSVGGPDQW